MRKRLFSGFLALSTVAFATSASVSADAHVTRPQNVGSQSALTPQVTVRPFASGAAKGLTNPDSIVVTKQHVYIAYQNNTPPTASNLTSTIVQYDRAGHALHALNITGRCDGMRWNPYTHTLWATVNEDANPGLYVISTHTGALKHYLFKWPTAHGGGFDDIAFSGGKAFVSASNPTLNAGGINVAPAVDEVALHSDGIAAVSPVLAGNALVRDTTTGALVHINAIDPDSMQVAPDGAVVLVDQAGTELIFIHNPGLRSQYATRIVTGTQLDDIDVTRSQHGSLFVVDAKKDITYEVTAASWPLGQIWTEAPSDSGVASFVGTFDLATGTVVPQLVGFGSPSGLVWVDDSAADEGP